MDLRERQSMPAIRHPWETVRAWFFSRVLSDALTTEQAVHVLDIGAGDAFVAGILARSLPKGSSITCVDSAYTNEQIATLRDTSPPSVQFAHTCPAREFDVLVLLDVIEHVAEDRTFLADLVRANLRIGGFALVSVPAHQALYTQHDVALGHYRRYSRQQLRQVTESAGLQVRCEGSLFGSLIGPRAVGKALEYVRGIRSQPTEELAATISTGVTEWKRGPIVTNVISRVLELDARLCELAARHSFPSSGLSVWAVCERRKR